MLFFSCSISPAAAQQADIRGVVSDSSNGDRIPYANLIIKDTNQGASANTLGFYLIPGVPSGTYIISASAVGYKRSEKIVVVQGSAPIIVNFRLKSQAVQLEEVVVTGRTKPKALEIQTSVHIVDKKDLEMVPVNTQGDVLRSIQILPGIVTTSDVNSQFYVRGGASDQNLILLDGMRIYNPFHAFGLFSSFDPDIVRSTEVYTGAFPVEFGGRLSSVINMASRDGNAGALSTKASVNFLSSKLQLEGPFTESIQAIVTARKSVFSTTFKNFLHQQVPLSFYDGLVKLSLKDPNEQNHYSIQAFVSHDELLSENPEEPDYLWSNKAFGMQASFLMSDRLFWNLTISLGQFDQRQDPKNSLTARPASNTVSEAGMSANITYYTEERDLYLFGFEFYFPKTEYTQINRLNASVSANGSSPQLSLWARYQKQFDRLKVELGLRAEVGNLFDGRSLKGSLQPRVNLGLDLFDDWKAKAAFGRFSQNILTVTNEDDILPIFTPWVTVPDNLDAEQADHYVLGIEGGITNRLSVNLQSYYKYYNSLVTYNRDKIDAGEPDYINAQGSSYGGEVLLRYAHPLIDVYSAYTLTWVRINLNGFEYAPRYDRRHTLNLLTSIHILQSLDLSLRWEFGSGLPFTQSIGFYDKLTLGRGFPNQSTTETGNPEALYGAKNASRLPTYHRMDVSLSYRAQLFSSFKTTVGINLINLYDRKNISYFDSNTGQRYNMLGFFPSATATLEF
ncbi:MAG: TonB-dependent receptor [Ignavibacteriales bacterium]|nr:TonB-dependent receptor [Ignavibacteriales bacterium]